MTDSRHQYVSISWRDMLPTLTTERMVLRLADEEDADALLDYNARNVEHFRPWSPTSSLTPTREQVLQSAEDKRESARLDKGYRFSIFLHDAAEVVGICNISEVRRGAIQQCVLGYAIDKDHQGKGLMTEAASAAVKFAFHDLDLHRIECSYMLANDASAKIASKLGFQREALFKEYLFLNGAWQDHIVTSLINPNWLGEGRRLG